MNPQNWGALGPRPLAIGVSVTPRNTPPPHPHVLFCRIWSFSMKWYRGTSIGGRRSLVLAIERATASAVARVYNGGLGTVPPAGSRCRAPGQGVWGRSRPEAEHNYTFHKPIFAEFWCHFGKILSFCKLLKLGLHVPWQFLS